MDTRKDKVNLLARSSTTRSGGHLLARFGRRARNGLPSPKKKVKERGWGLRNMFNSKTVFSFGSNKYMFECESENFAHSLGMVVFIATWIRFWIWFMMRFRVWKLCLFACYGVCYLIPNLIVRELHGNKKREGTGDLERTHCKCRWAPVWAWQGRIAEYVDEIIDLL